MPVLDRSRLEMPAHHLKTLRALLAQHVPNANVWAYGSRVTGGAHEGSDLDLVLRNPTDLTQDVEGWYELKEALQESTLPILVEVHLWSRLPQAFHHNIEAGYVVVQKAGRCLVLESEHQLRFFGDLVNFVSEKSKADHTRLKTYISTENMQPNFGGISMATTLPENGSVTRFKTGDTLFSNIRTYFKKVWQADFDGYCSNDVLVLRPKDENVLCPSYLHYLCRWGKFTEFSVRTSKGAKMPRGDKDALAQFQLELPPTEEQQTIAKFLRSLDDKIDLNRRINQSLEAMAQAIFKSWFVDFDAVKAKIAAKAEGRDPLRAAMSAISGKHEAELDTLPPEAFDQLAATAALFPDEMEDSELGGIPRGWDPTPIREVAEVVKGKSYSSKDLIDNDQVALVTLKSFERGGGFRMDGFKPYVGPYKADQVVASGDLIVAYTDVTQAAELIGKPAVVVGVEPFKTLVASLDVGIVRPVFKKVSRQFLYGLFMTDAFQSHTFSHTSGTTVLHLAKEGVPSYIFACPDDRLVGVYSEVAEAVTMEKQKLLDQNRSLASLRDTLLPKLLSGELSVADIAPVIDEVPT